MIAPLHYVLLGSWASYLSTSENLAFQTRSSATAEKQRVSCPHGGGLDPRAHSPSSGYTYAYGRIRNPQQTYVKRAVRIAHFKMNRAFKVIQGHPYWCRQESRMVCYRNVQLMPTSFLKLTQIRQRENGRFVDFNDLAQVWRRPSKKCLRISTNDLYYQKLEFLSLLVWVYVHQFSRNYASKSNPLNIKLLVRKPSFTWNSHSGSF